MCILTFKTSSIICWTVTLKFNGSSIKNIKVKSVKFIFEMQIFVIMQPSFRNPEYAFDVGLSFVQVVV